MVKSKRITGKIVKPKLKTNLSKKKPLKSSSALLKKLALGQLQDDLWLSYPLKSRKSVKTEDSAHSEDDISADETTGHLVKAPETSISKSQFKNGVKALFQYISKKTENKIGLFDEEQPIFLQVTAIKVPRTPDRQVRLSLKHPLLTDASEICLIVKDVGKPKDYDGTIEHYQKLLIDHDITNIKTIMPFHQFKSEYGNQFELKRKFLGLYDYFLVDGRMSGKVTHLLGKIFFEKRKMPTPVKMDATDLKNHIERMLRKTLMKIHSKSDSFMVQVGHSKMEQHEVFENICEIVDELSSAFPGGIDNIRQLGLKTEKSCTVPIYLTLKRKNDVNVPVILPKRPKQCKSITGELTTLLNKDVKVLPSGRVILIDNDENDEDCQDEDLSDLGISNEDEEEELNEDEDQAQSDASSLGEDKSEEKSKKPKGKTKNEDQEEMEEDDLMEAEQMYLNEYEQSKTSKGKKAKAAENKKKNKVSTEKEENINDTQKNRQKRKMQTITNDETAQKDTENVKNTIPKGILEKKSKKAQDKNQAQKKTPKAVQKGNAPKKSRKR